MKKNTFTLTALFPCTAEVLFSLLTNSKYIANWSGHKGKMEPTIGGKFEFFDKWVKGIVLAFEPGKQLAFTWKPAEWPKEQDSSIVSCRFKSTKSGSNLILKHTGFPNEAEAANHKQGWSQFVFEPLNMYLSKNTKVIKT
jgi:uncharacterized protein YndB with AHSA1/START domain